MDTVPMVNLDWALSAVGPSRPKWHVPAMSGFPSLATNQRTLLEVRFVPKADSSIADAGQWVRRVGVTL